MPSLGFRVNSPTSNPSIPQAKVSGDGLMSNWRGKGSGPDLPALLSASSCSSAARLGYSNPHSDRGAARLDRAALLGKPHTFPGLERGEMLPVSPHCLGITSHQG